MATGPEPTDELHAERHAAFSGHQRQSNRGKTKVCPQRAERWVAGRGSLRRDTGRSWRNDGIALLLKQLLKRVAQRKSIVDCTMRAREVDSCKTQRSFFLRSLMDVPPTAGL